MKHSLTRILSVVIIIAAISLGPLWAHAQALPAQQLSSWNDGPAKEAILQFVASVTSQSAPTFVPPAERIAVFDNDGTLWCEQPLYVQFAFALDRIRALAPMHPEWQDHPALGAVIKGDMQALAASGEKGMMEVLAVTHAGMTTDEFARSVSDWLTSARHPRFQRPYTDLVYQPMLELVAYLRDNGFKTYIVSGGGVEFMRVFAERVYGIPPEEDVSQVLMCALLCKMSVSGAAHPNTIE